MVPIFLFTAKFSAKRGDDSRSQQMFTTENSAKRGDGMVTISLLLIAIIVGWLVGWLVRANFQCTASHKTCICTIMNAVLHPKSTRKKYIPAYNL